MNFIETGMQFFRQLSFVPISMWISLTFYLVCFFPQIVTNYVVKSGTGISEFMLLGYLNTYIFLLFYIFCLPLPFAYRCMVPLHALATVVIIGQRLYYDTTPPGLRLRWLYAGNIIFFMLFIPVAFKHSLTIGAVFGWGSFLLTTVSQLPQAVKIYQSKSVAGFHFGFVLFTGLAAMLETMVALIVGLPMQTLVSAARGTIMFLIFCWQFFLYRA